jgi:hypothetical protein
MEHLKDHGNLDSFPGSQDEKLALMMTARRQGLVRWNRRTRCYELSSLRRKRSGMRRILRESDGRTDPPPSSASSGKRWTGGSSTIIAAIAGMAIGAAGMALLSADSGAGWSRDGTILHTPPSRPIPYPGAKNRSLVACPLYHSSRRSAWVPFARNEPLISAAKNKPEKRVPMLARMMPTASIRII